MSGEVRAGGGHSWMARLVLLLLAVFLCPSGLDGAVNCPKVSKRECICNTGKDWSQIGGWEISCFQPDYRIVYAIGNYVKLDCSYNEPIYAASMFRKYNLSDVYYFRFDMCALPINLTMAEILDGVTVKKLKFEGDAPGIYFDSSTFQGLESLQSLDLKKNQLKSVPEDLFSNLTLLKTIFLNENYLTSLPESLFQGLAHLARIELSANSLKEIPSGIFSNLTKLESLYLYKNKLTELPAGIFLGLKSLKVLDLADNQIYELHPELFLDTPKLINLNIRVNNLTRLQSDLFQGTKHLEQLHLENNNFTKLPENLMEGLNALKKITLDNCNLTGIGERFFSFAANLTSISMKNNRLTSLPDGLFRSNAVLEEIFLNSNDILELPPNIFDRTVKLATLVINNNNLTSLPAGIFDHLSKLEKLDLTGNGLKRLDKKLLLQTQRLKELFLNKNQLTRLEGNLPFGESSQLTTVDLSDNQITSLSDEINWSVYLSLEKLNLHANNLTVLIVPVIYSPGTNLQFTNNQIRRVDLKNFLFHESVQTNPSITRTIIDLAGNPLDCNCSLFSFYNYTTHDNYRKTVKFVEFEDLSCEGPPILAGTKLTDVRPDEFICQVKDGCSPNCQCIERALDKAIIVNCSNLTELPRTLPAGTTDVHLEDNRLSGLEPLGSYIWENVTRLYLDRNNITVGDWNLPAHLRVLSLTGNLLKYLPQSFTDYVEKNPNIQVYLGDNPWLCDCDTLDMKDWLYENVKHVRDINEMYCSQPVFQNGSEVRTTIGRLTDEICPARNEVNNSHLITVSVICVILAVLLFIVSVLYYRNKQTVIAYFYIHFYHVFVCFFNEDDLDEDKTFDAFVSYSTADRDVAMDLIGHLETGDPSFKLCIHERDWLPGNLISWNIVNSVQNSRKTILVLSKHFLDSVWFQVEFHTAYYQMLEDRIDRLIVIVRGDLPDKNTLDKDLQYLLSTKTFLVWGERWFWEKLRYALPHRRRTSNALASKASMQDKSFPLRQRPNPGLLKTVEEKIVSLSGDTIFSTKRNDSPRNGDVQSNTPRRVDVQPNSLCNGDAQSNTPRRVDAQPNSPPSCDVQPNSPPNCDVQSNTPRNGDVQSQDINNKSNAVPINSSKAQSRRFNSAKTNAAQNGSQNNHVTQDVIPV